MAGEASAAPLSSPVYGFYVALPGGLPPLVSEAVANQEATVAWINAEVQAYLAADGSAAQRELHFAMEAGPQPWNATMRAIEAGSNAEEAQATLLGVAVVVLLQQAPLQSDDPFGLFDDLDAFFVALQTQWQDAGYNPAGLPALLRDWHVQTLRYLGSAMACLGTDATLATVAARLQQELLLVLSPHPADRPPDSGADEPLQRMLEVVCQRLFALLSWAPSSTEPASPALGDRRQTPPFAEALAHVLLGVEGDLELGRLRLQDLVLEVCGGSGSGRASTCVCARRATLVRGRACRWPALCVILATCVSPPANSMVGCWRPRTASRLCRCLLPFGFLPPPLSPPPPLARFPPGVGVGTRLHS